PPPAAALPAGIEPDRDLWPAIEARIASMPASGEKRERSVLRGWPTQLAAALALMAVASLVTFMMVDSADRAPAPAERAPDMLALSDIWAEPARFGVRYALGQDYLDARAALTATLQQRLGAMPPETRRVVIANLIEIRRALDAINVALVEDPDNALLQRMLLRTYQDEMFVLANLNSTTVPIGERIEL
ncbi:MAG: hypothetical protein ACREVN_03650, partial [Gammaproteobacteria bacterium]